MVAPVLTKVCRWAIKPLAGSWLPVFLLNTILLVLRIHGAESKPGAEWEWSVGYLYHGLMHRELVQMYQSGIGLPPPAQGKTMVQISKSGGLHQKKSTQKDQRLGSKASRG